MFRPRVIPVLLLKGKGLVKSVRFKDYKYIGDPINAVKIFNDLHADELVLLDILATSEGRSISIDLVQKIGDEANMPFAVGGGITTIREIKSIINAGAEKVVINSHAFKNPDFIRDASGKFGSSTIVVSMDVKKNFWGKEVVHLHGGGKVEGLSVVDWAKRFEEKGAGEIILNSVEHDGLMAGFHLELVKRVSDAVNIPVVALGGAGQLADLQKAVKESYASAVAAGSLFVFHGERRGVLLNYPGQKTLLELFNEQP